LGFKKIPDGLKPSLQAINQGSFVMLSRGLARCAGGLRCRPQLIYSAVAWCPQVLSR
jgi:hypothetical protein